MQENSTKTTCTLVNEFHECMSQPIATVVCGETMDLFKFRVALINEEVREVLEACQLLHNCIKRNNNVAAVNSAKEHVLKELQDLKYVIEGMCVTFGWDSDKAFELVHESNMSKLVDGKPYKNEEGKVMKGPNYKKPDLKGLLNEEKEEAWRRERYKEVEKNAEVQSS